MDMDVEEMQFLGFFGFFKESFKLLVRHARLMAWFALILVLPLSFALLGHTLVTDPLLNRIRLNEEMLAVERSDGHSAAAVHTRRELYSEFGRLGTLLLAYLVFVLAFSLLSTAAVVYSVACIYVDKSVTVAKVLGVVPRVWKRLMVTFLWVFLIMFAYHVTFIVSVGLLLVALGSVPALLLPLLLLLALAFFALQVYLNVIWHLASVITVLEEHYGIAALKKSARVVKGKRMVGSCLVFTHMVASGIIAALFHARVVSANSRLPSAGPRLSLAALLVALLTLVNLLGMLLQSLFYFSVKSFHHESIDRMVLSDHLDAYMGEYVPLKDPDIQMEVMEP
ncbi:uncharacterized protein LOC9660321 [Selaginella moellendorffii]|nr:uncharacterized protein LOC9660321 [Selaginella moellendorffii]|eukprot:XP_024529919.1 uncharacterized protein LOC9660321 [Selaginella moellendorffii]